MTPATDPASPTRTFDLTLVGQEYFVATAGRRRANAVIGGALAAVAILGGGGFILVGVFGFPPGSWHQLLDFGGATLFLAIGFQIARLLRKDPRDGVVERLNIDLAGALTFLLHDGERVEIQLTDSAHPIRILDYRTTTQGVEEGTPCLLNPARRAIPITGLACDAILEVARAHQVPIATGSTPTASMSGRSLGRAIVWDINPGTGIRGWLRRN